MTYDTSLDKGELRAEIQGLKNDLRMLFWMMAANLAGVAALCAIVITAGLYALHLI